VESEEREQQRAEERQNEEEYTKPSDETEEIKMNGNKGGGMMIYIPDR
jgi:hypothetical protein